MARHGGGGVGAQSCCGKSSRLLKSGQFSVILSITQHSGHTPHLELCELVHRNVTVMVPAARVKWYLLCARYCSTMSLMRAVPSRLCRLQFASNERAHTRAPSHGVTQVRGTADPHRSNGRGGAARVFAAPSHGLHGVRMGGTDPRPVITLSVRYLTVSHANWQRRVQNTKHTRCTVRAAAAHRAISLRIRW